MITGKNLLSFMVLSFTLSLVNAQQTDTVDLFRCYKLVHANSPQTGLLDINRRSTDLEIQKIKSNNLPNVTGFGKATYQSDAVSMSFPIPGAAGIEVDKLQYNAGINIDQKLFDGGLVAMQKEIKRIEGEMKNLETEASLYKMNELVNNYFFGIVTMQKSIEIIQLRTGTLEERRKTVSSGVRNGMVLQAELDRIDAEILSSNQQITEIQIAMKQMENNLKVLAGFDPNTQIYWKIPEIIKTNDSLSRFEIQLCVQNRNLADAMMSLQNKRYIPRLYAYGQLGYSYPGLNMFENEPADFYIVGVKLSWQIFDWNMAKKEKQLIVLQKDRIDITETDFKRNLQLSIDSEEEESFKLKQLIFDDQKIIKAKEAITKASASSLDNGIITTADYLNDLNSELRAKFDFESHKITLSESNARLAVLKGINVKQF